VKFNLSEIFNHKKIHSPLLADSIL